MLRHLIFDKTMKVFIDREKDGEQPIVCTDEQRDEALIRALCEILSRVTMDETYLPFVCGGDFQVYPNDLYHLCESYYLVECRTKDELRWVLRKSMPLLRSKVGVVCFLFSLIMARTEELIKREVDDPSQPLVLPQFGHCSQELVNLVLSGRAVTNVHDGDKKLGSGESSFLLRGISPIQTIGFLSTLEVMRYTKVGDHYKNPSFPVWVVGSSAAILSLNSSKPS